MDLTVRHAGRLLTMTGEPLSDAAVVVRAGRVAWVGPDAELPADAPEPTLDAAGACVVPGFVDAHTHLLFAGVRRAEFVARLAGTTYDGGGIRTTVEATAAATDDELLDLAAGRVAAALAHGTTTMEVKSGYGLTVESELRLLGLVAELARRTPVRLEATYLGAHVVPAGRDRDDYVDEVVATLPLAAEARGPLGGRLLRPRASSPSTRPGGSSRPPGSTASGLRLHAEEIARTGAAALAAELGCASADHLEHVSAEDARAMAAAGVVGGAAADGHPVAAVAGVGARRRPAGGRGRAGAGDGLQPGHVMVRVDALRDPARLPGDGAVGRRGVPRRDARARPTRCAGTTSVTWRSARTVTWRCWTPSTRPTWWRTSAGGRCRRPWWGEWSAGQLAASRASIAPSTSRCSRSWPWAQSA